MKLEVQSKIVENRREKFQGLGVGRQKMVRPRQRIKVKNPARKVSMKKNSKRRAPQISRGILSKQWEKDKTLQENYQELGLSRNVNEIGSRKLRKEVNRVAVEMDIDEIEDNKVFEKLLKSMEENENEEKPKKKNALFENIKPEVKKEHHQSAQEIEFVKDLIEKYGNDYGKMAKDKLNVHQFTINQIKKKCIKYLASNK